LLPNNSTLELRVRPGTDQQNREAVLHRWYRRLLREQILELIAKWQPVIGVNVAAWGIKKMKTRWGTCNIAARRIWLNLELAKKTPSCLEYILVHEMIHLLERHHNDVFRDYMDRFMPQWRIHRDELNRSSLGHESWSY
jgi:predicted metal-dependent hydrolase